MRKKVAYSLQQCKIDVNTKPILESPLSMMEDDWITTDAAAEVSRFHVEHIRELARAGTILSKKWGRSWMISRASLLDYLAGERKPGPKIKKSSDTDNISR